MLRYLAAALLGALLWAGPAAAAPYGDAGVAMSVAGVECAPEAGGERCAVTVRLVDISDGVTVFDEQEQVAYDAAGRAFRPDPGATAAANTGPVTRRLPRGEPVSSVLVYRLPPGSRIDRLVLHGNIGSPGETFTVR